MKKLLLTIVFLASSLWCYERPLPEAKSFPKPIEITNEFSPLNLQKYIIEKRIKFPQIVYAQSLLETGEFKSTIFKENNNLFGMKYVGNYNPKYGRPTTAVGSRYGHAFYKNWKLSVDDYFLWQQMFKKTPTEKEEEYFALLKKKYAEDKRYVSALKIIIQKDTTRW
jgi:flagellum-specific peptidoglycan hydrolase FlgJ